MAPVTLNKEFLCINCQINLLKKRGLNFLDLEASRDFLLRKNYYNSANLYGKYFHTHFNSNSFVENSTFDEIRSVYYFEKNIRDMTFNLIMNVEANFKSTLSYFFVEKYKDIDAYRYKINFDLTSYVDAIDDYKYLKRRFSKIRRSNYDPSNQRDNSIDHYLRKGQSLPFWVIINYFTFGDMCVFYKLLHYDLQETIAKSFSLMLSKSYSRKVHLSSQQLIEYLEAIKQLRNTIAHDVCIPKFRLNKNLSLHLLNRGEYVQPNDPKSKFYDVLLVTRFFISQENFYSQIDMILNEISNLESSISSISLNRLMSDFGFNFYS